MPHAHHSYSEISLGMEDFIKQRYSVYFCRPDRLPTAHHPPSPAQLLCGPWLTTTGCKSSKLQLCSTCFQTDLQTTVQRHTVSNPLVLAPYAYSTHSLLSPGILESNHLRAVCCKQKHKQRTKEYMRWKQPEARDPPHMCLH
jgi:hypothetical protein